MSIDVMSIVYELSLLIAGIILFFLISRGVMIGRKFVSRVYRSRAFWFVGVMLVALITVLSGLITDLFGLYPSTPLAPLFILVFLAWVLVMFAYADRTILVTLEMDFLHRNTLHWRPVRTLAYAAIFASVFYLYAFISVTKPPTCSSGLCPTVFLPGLPPWVPAIFPSTYFGLAGPFLALIMTFGYTLSAIIICARRTSDTMMKRHVRWLGLSFLIFLVIIVGFILPSTWSDLLASFAVLVLVYTFYRASTSLTFIGKVEVETK
jgi:hypothetical protein